MCPNSGRTLSICMCICMWLLQLTRCLPEITLRPEQGCVLSLEPLDHIHAALEENIASHLLHCQCQGEHGSMGVHPHQRVASCEHIATLVV